jgi:hypothetical protein
MLHALPSQIDKEYILKVLEKEFKFTIKVQNYLRNIFNWLLREVTKIHIRRKRYEQNQERLTQHEFPLSIKVVVKVTGKITRLLNKKFWEELISCFPLIRHWRHRKLKKLGEYTDRGKARWSHKPPLIFFKIRKVGWKEVLSVYQNFETWIVFIGRLMDTLKYKFACLKSRIENISEYYVIY